MSNNFYQSVLNKFALVDSDFKVLLQNTLLREAIYLASPELFAQILKWENGELTDLKKIEKLQFSILKYFTRITTRCTPFGLFAACGVGEFGEETNVELKELKSYKRLTRFDTTFLTQLTQILIKHKTIRPQLQFYPNTSLYKINDHYRYVEYSIEKKARNYTLEGISYSEYIDLILKNSSNGKTISDLSTLLINDNITQNEAEDFIEELIENQVLVSELEITVTGNDYFKSLLKRIKTIPEASKLHKQLLELYAELTELDKIIGNNPSVYQKLILLTKKFVPDLDSKYLFQTDCFSSSHKNTLDNSMKQQLLKAFTLFNRMTLPTGNAYIEEFKTEFSNRFEQSEIPLSIALDTETGIGFGTKKEDTNPLLDDLSLKDSEKRYRRIIWTDVDSILQKKLVNATHNNDYTIQLTESDFENLLLKYDDLPDTFSSIIEVYDSKIFIDNIGGASATNLLGRFSYGNEKLLKHVSKIVDTEEELNKNKILAEIVHLPEARTGNILQRPNIRAYEIPYLGKSSVKEAYQIPIDDIMVSVRNNRIILRSKHLGKEVIPRLGNAHNYSFNSLPIYYFLCSLQTQNKRSSIGFNWNSILQNQVFLPRVEFENMILSKARWIIETKRFKALFERKNLGIEIKKWQENLLLPNYVELVEGDNRLLISLKNKTSVKMLFDTIKNKTKFIIEEFLFTDKCIVKNTESESYCNQLVISFYNNKKIDATK
ncbi:lantibiotic dehydratase family protein [Winogradskyella sp. R77965]|uniref:lantibiotic dehydratase family protein n=1 Tax=Winogradskyella sp. R77965 TaxID=3093872 RepID=UPI0037DD750C